MLSCRTCLSVNRPVQPAKTIIERVMAYQEDHLAKWLAGVIIIVQVCGFSTKSTRNRINRLILY
jgi:hypothetical protein